MNDCSEYSSRLGPGRRARRVAARTMVLALAFGSAAVATDTGTADAISIQPRIVNGRGLNSGEFPFIVSLVNATAPTNPDSQFCGGALVAPSIVLTAAHCVYDEQNPPQLINYHSIDVVYGSRHLGSGTVATLASILPNQNYDPTVATNDLALLYLAAPATGIPTARIVPPEIDWVTNAGRQLDVAGWGCSSFDPNDLYGCASYPLDARVATITAQPGSVCSTLFGSDYNATTGICAGSTSLSGRAPDACFGDSGGPLATQIGADYFLTGIVSYGFACGSVPGVYTRLSTYRTWLVANGVPDPNASPYAPISDAMTAGWATALNGNYTPITGDFDGDGKTDIVWYTPGTGADYVWLGGASGFDKTNANWAINVNGKYVPFPGDWNGDGKDDILWYQPGTGTDFVWLGGATNAGFNKTAQTYTVGGTYQPVPGDFNGDGYTDIVWYTPGPRADYLWVNHSGTFQDGQVGVNVGGYYAPTVGDLNGDGKDDIYWYQAGGTDSEWRGAATLDSAGFDFTATAPQIDMRANINGKVQGATVFAGDFFDLGRSMLGTYQPGPGGEVIISGLTNHVGRKFNANSSYTVVPGDYDGDGYLDIVFFGPGLAPDGMLLGTA